MVYLEIGTFNLMIGNNINMIIRAKSTERLSRIVINMIAIVWTRY
jgi:hypothetical protein